MKHSLLLATGVAAALAFSSCKKDDKPVPNNPGTTKQLKKVTKTEGGATTVYNLTYDAARRLTAYKTPDNSEYILFTYDANGNLSSLEQREDNEFKNLYTYTYVNNVPASATFKSWQLTAGEPDALIEEDLLTYTVTNNQVSRIKLEMIQGSAEVNLLLTYANGNLTQVRSEEPSAYTANFTYGNKRSALPKVTNWILDQAGLSLFFGSNNDIRSIVYDFPGTAADKTINTTYTYDSDGYVLTSNDGSAQLVYEYQ